MNILLSQLSGSKINPRKVKAGREAHQRLVASIKSHGLIEPLVVQKTGEESYTVIAGHRRLAALREVHRGEDAKVPCVVRSVDEPDEVLSLSLAENFVREAMHPLDEAVCFATLAREQGQEAGEIARSFGVSETYVRQRMKLAGLCQPVKRALRENRVTLAVAEAFCAVPVERQAELWAELSGQPRDAKQVRAMIEHDWIDATHALFDMSTLEPSAVSQDLFGGSVLVERSAFMRQQAEALESLRGELLEEGWAEVVIAERSQVQDRLYRMDAAPCEYDKAVRKQLEQWRKRREELETTQAESEEDEVRLTDELAALDEQERAYMASHPGTYAEETKARGTVFLMLGTDGRVERRYAVPRESRKAGASGNGSNAGQTAERGREPAPTTSDDLSPRQLAHAYWHEVLAVREAVSLDKLARKRLLVLALHPKVRTDGLAIRTEVNITGRRASEEGTFTSGLLDAQIERLDSVDPFAATPSVDEDTAYAMLMDLTERQLDTLICVLIVDRLTFHGQRDTPLVRLLCEELKVQVRESWTPDAEWLSGYTKLQLADLLGTLKGHDHRSAAIQRKKSELVAELAGLFERAAKEPKSLGDAGLAERARAWMPKAMREEGSGGCSRLGGIVTEGVADGEG